MPKLTTRSICTVAMILAITAILAIFCTFRIGTVIKIPFKFISVFVTGVLFGPLLGGFVGAAGDILNVILMPSGPWLPQLTFCEFISGVVFGVFFYRLGYNVKSYTIRSISCTLVGFVLDMFLTTYFLVGAGYFPGFTIAFETRLAAGIIKMILQCAILITSRMFFLRFSTIIAKLTDTNIR